MQILRFCRNPVKSRERSWSDSSAIDCFFNYKDRRLLRQETCCLSAYLDKAKDEFFGHLRCGEWPRILVFRTAVSFRVLLGTWNFLLMVSSTSFPLPCMHAQKKKKKKKMSTVSPSSSSSTLGAEQALWSICLFLTWMGVHQNSTPPRWKFANEWGLHQVANIWWGNFKNAVFERSTPWNEYSGCSTYPRPPYFVA